MINLKILQSGKVTQHQKENYVERCISKEFEKYDRETNSVNIPYFQRAAQKVQEIKRNGELDKVYNEFKKGNK